MANLRYFLIDTVDLDAAITDCKPRHEDVAKPCLLSVRLSKDSSQALIKCQGADKAWRTGRTWVDSAVAVYDRDNYRDMAAFIYTEKWRKV